MQLKLTVCQKRSPLYHSAGSPGLMVYSAYFWEAIKENYYFSAKFSSPRIKCDETVLVGDVQGCEGMRVLLLHGWHFTIYGVNVKCVNMKNIMTFILWIDNVAHFYPQTTEWNQTLPFSLQARCLPSRSSGCSFYFFLFSLTFLILFIFIGQLTFFFFFFMLLFT